MLNNKNDLNVSLCLSRLNKYNIFADMDRLYGSHKPTNFAQKSILAVGSGIMSISDPSRDDMISIFGETTGGLALKYIQEKMIIDPEGEQILK